MQRRRHVDRLPFEAESVQRPSQMAGELTVSDSVKVRSSKRLSLHQFALNCEHCGTANQLLLGLCQISVRRDRWLCVPHNSEPLRRNAVALLLHEWELLRLVARPDALPFPYLIAFGEEAAFFAFRFHASQKLARYSQNFDLFSCSLMA